MKVRVPGSISRATALNRPSPIASQRTDPTKSDVSVPGNACIDEPGRLPVGLQRETRGVAQHALAQQVAAHQPRTRFQVVERDPGGAAFLSGGAPGRWRRRGAGWPPPRPRRCGGGHSAASRRWDPPRAPLTDTAHQRPAPMGRNREFSQRLHLPVRTVSPPSSVISRSPVRSTTDSAAIRLPSRVVEIDSGTDGRNVRMKGGGRGTARLGGSDSRTPSRRSCRPHWRNAQSPESPAWAAGPSGPPETAARC